MYTSTTLASLLALAPFALAVPHWSAQPPPPTTTGTTSKNFDITVGLGGLKFTPDRIRAAKGDTLTFTYFPKAHTVTTSSFAQPCQPLNGTASQRINSGFVPVMDQFNATGGPQQFVVTVQDDKAPLWIYCAQTTGSHCQKGMNMVVNEPADPAKSLNKYRELAAKTNVSIAAPNVEGGVFQPNKRAIIGTSPPYPTSTAAPAASSTPVAMPPKQTMGYDNGNKDGSKSGDYNNNNNNGNKYNGGSSSGDNNGKPLELCTCPPSPSYHSGATAYLRARSAQAAAAAQANSASSVANSAFVAAFLEALEKTEGSNSAADAAAVA